MEEPDYTNETTIETEFLLPNQLDGSRAPQKIKIFPKITKNWSFTSISVFLNELSRFIKPTRRPFKKTGATLDTECQYYFTHTEFSKYFIKVVINRAITVYASSAWVKRYWNRNSIADLSDLRVGGKRRVKPQLQVLEFFTYSLRDITLGTKCLYSHSPLLHCSVHDFSPVFHYFSKRIIEHGIPFDIDTCSLFEYRDLFIEKQQKNINSLKTLQEKVRGYLSLDVQECSTKRYLPQINHAGKLMYIVGGVYISPAAHSVLQSEKVKGILLDTTWRVMPMFVTSIIMASTMNIGIPVGFAFGSGEDKTLYNRHFKAFKEKAAIDISKLVIESDQGSALTAICDEYHVTHIACLRHLLVSLKFSPYSYAIGKLIRCASMFELNNAMTTFADLFSKIKDSDELVALNKALGKVGLEFIDGSLNLIDQNKWDRVSMLARIEYRMPSTTNSLESFHGHLNKKTPRRNGFWPSLYRLCSSLVVNHNMINKRIAHNYSFVKRTTEKKVNALTADEMARQRIYYSSRLDHCNCSENKLISAIMEKDVPCSHRVTLGTRFEECPTLNIAIEPQFDKLEVDLNELPPKHNTNPYDEHIGSKMYVVNVIKRFSCYKNKKEIEEYVETRYNPDGDDSFLLEEESSLTYLIYSGINHFTEKRRVQKLSKKPSLASQVDERN